MNKPINTQQPDTLLLIGGTDPGGSGLQTDWRVAGALNIPAYSVVSAVTAQNTQQVTAETGVLPPEPVTAQLDSVIHSLQSSTDNPLAAVKVGMLGDEQVITALLSRLPALRACGEHVCLIVDPLVCASSGTKLLSDDGLRLLVDELLPQTDLLTPNVPELSVLTGREITNTADIEQAAQQLVSAGVKAVLVKGGHFDEVTQQSSDYFRSTDDAFWLMGRRWDNRHNVRGTGCLFATAVACALAQQHALSDALVLAKALVSQAIRLATPFDGVHRAHIAVNQVQDWGISYQDMPQLVHRRPDTPRLTFASCETRRLGIYPVVDSAEWVQKLVAEGIKTIQLRIKTDVPEPPSEAFVEQEIIAAIAVCQPENVRLFINDHWQLAVKHGAYGIHLGQEDLHGVDTADLAVIANSGCRLGVSTHSYTEVARALWVNPSYIALGPIYATDSKQMPWVPQGVAAVERWVKLLGEHYPLVAIGGIDLQRAKDLQSTGVGSVAMISAITQAADYRRAVADLFGLE